MPVEGKHLSPCSYDKFFLSVLFLLDNFNNEKLFLELLFYTQSNPVLTKTAVTSHFPAEEVALVDTVSFAIIP